MKIEVEVRRVDVLVDLLLSEIEMLRDFLDESERTLDHRNQLIAEKAEIIRMLGQQTKAAPKRGPGRPKGGKKGKSK